VGSELVGTLTDVSNGNAAESVASLVPLITEWVEFQAWYREIPSLAVGIAIDGEPMLAIGHGRADLESGMAAAASTRYRIASHSKVFTATAVVGLVASGDLRLDDPVSSHLGWFRSAVSPELEHVTIRQLLSHSAGIVRDGATTHWYDDRFPDVDEIVAQSDTGMAVIGPVEKLKYSNIGFTVLGQVIEAVTGVSYERHVTEHILKPLGMMETSPDLPDDLTDHAVGYPSRYPGRARHPIPHIRAKVMNAATGFSSSVNDLLVWYAAHCYGSRLLFDDRHKREMQRLQFEGVGSRWGLGFQLASHGGLDFVTHGGGYPGFITYSGLNQKHRLAIVVLTNSQDGPARELFGGIANLVRKALDGSFADEGSGERLDWSTVAGFYESRWGIDQVAQVADRLVTISPTLADPAATLQVLDHVEGLRFRFPDNVATASPCEEVWFEPGEVPVMHAPAAPPYPRSLPWVSETPPG
jgi:D-alanyl-D-alanine carboxypeptidase